MPMTIKDQFVEYQLIHSSPETVFGWLQDNVARELDSLDSDELEGFEKSLLERNNKLINLGLALYGKSPEVAYYLFIDGDDTIKKACCSGKSVKPEILSDSWIEKEEVLPAILNDWNSDFLVELAANSGLPDSLLVKLFKKEKPFDQLDEEKWTLLMAWSSHNERLSRRYASNWMDGYEEYLYNEVFFSAWEAFGKVTPTPRNASAMSSLGARLVRLTPINTNIIDIINKWRSSDEEDDERLGYVRAVLTKILDRDTFNKLKESDDVALRKGYYTYHEYCSAEEVIEDFERDGKHFLDCAIFNESIFRNTDVRSTFRKCSWEAPDEHSRLDYPNFYNSREEYWKLKHPEWFNDIYGEDYPVEEIDDFETRVDRRLAIMNSQINDLSRVVIGDGEKDRYRNVEQIGLKETLYSETKTIAELLVKIQHQNAAQWGWGIAGLAIGFIAAKLF